MTEPLIELKGVSKSFGSHKVLDNVDLTIYRGEALGIIGPSGTGKSTILRVMAGLLAPDEGEIYVQGVRRDGLIEDGGQPVGIGMVFQQAALFDSLTVEENVGFLLYQNSKLARSRIRRFGKRKIGDGRFAINKPPLPSRTFRGNAKTGKFCPCNHV